MPTRVLIVDDSSAMRAYVRAALEDDPDLRAEVSEAQDGFDALRVLSREPFDLVVLDINMPNINGLEMISFMRGSGRHQRTPLLVISTEASSRDRERALKLGANGYLGKPFTVDALLSAVCEVRKAGGEE